MTIQWLGQSCFKIQTKNLGEEITIATDPFDQVPGLKLSKFQADIVTVSHAHPDHNNLEAIKGDPFVIDNPGEFEIKNVFIYGLPAFHDDKEGKERGTVVIYKIISEDLNIVHLSDLGQVLTDEQVEKLGNVDILLIPVGGAVTIDGKKAAEIVSQIEPLIVIPMHYKTAGQTTKLDTADTFIKNCGLPVEKMDKLKIAKKDLLGQEQTKLIMLNI